MVASPFPDVLARFKSRRVPDYGLSFLNEKMWPREVHLSSAFEIFEVRHQKDAKEVHDSLWKLSSLFKFQMYVLTLGGFRIQVAAVHELRSLRLSVCQKLSSSTHISQKKR